MNVPALPFELTCKRKVSFHVFMNPIKLHNFSYSTLLWGSMHVVGKSGGE